MNGIDELILEFEMQNLLPVDNLDEYIILIIWDAWKIMSVFII